MRTMVKQAIAVLLVVQLIWAGEAPRIKTDWKGFQQQVARHKLGNRTARISLITGETISTFFLNTSDDGLVVQTDKNTRKWAMKEGNALVPNDRFWRPVSRKDRQRRLYRRRGRIGGRGWRCCSSSIVSARQL